MKLRKEYQIIIIITFLITMIAITETNFPDQLQLSEYHYVKEQRIISSPDKYEDTKVSSTAVIKEVVSVNASYDMLTTLNDLLLEAKTSLNIEKYDDIAFRGIAFLTSKGFIEVTEIHKFNASVYYYSAPGIVLFLVIFFYFFTFDFKKLSFSPRRNKNA
ncbi:MAG: hypothetical protein ACTSYA_07690 [Candidatus Kariarchaeaceae archaeon]